MNAEISPLNDYDETTCKWSVTGNGSFRCILDAGHNGLHQVVFGDAEHFAPVAEPRMCDEHCQVHPCTECAKLDAAFDEIYPPEPRTPSQRETLTDHVEYLEAMTVMIEQGDFSLRLRDEPVPVIDRTVAESIHAILAALRTVTQPAPTGEQVEALRRANVWSDRREGWNAAIDAVLALYGESAAHDKEEESTKPKPPAKTGFGNL